MEAIRKKVEKINEFWSRMVIGNRMLQKNVRYTDEERTNYIADIFYYFEETLNLIPKDDLNPENKNLLEAIGLMQIIYAQQDLLDELLYVFCLQTSDIMDKNPNRKIRNEFVGHPIRRNRNKELISSIFISKDFNPQKIDYVLYSKENGFKGIMNDYTIKDVLSNHKRFLNKYLDKINLRIKNILTKFRKEIIALQTAMNSNIPYLQLLEFVDQRYEKIFKEEYFFTKEIQISCFNRRDLHERYNYAVHVFRSTIANHLENTISYIDSLLNNDNKTPVTESKLPFDLELEKGSNVKNINIKTTYDYEFSKLFENHPIWGLNYFKENFQDHIILAELENMENSQAEFYISYNYLRLLLTDRKLLTDY